MQPFRYLVLATAFTLPCGIAAANNDDDGFVWIDANTRIKIKPVGTAAGGGSAAEKAAPEKAPKKAEKKEKPRK